MDRSMWWQTGVIYQIYPRSFADANGDGVGDLQGIISRLDYLTELGVDAIWLSPIFPSPMADFGYDVANYVDIDPVFGTLSDFDELVAEAHARGLRLILDLVPNHTSDEHPWFVDARSSRDGPRRDWYLWRDPGAGGSPPNQWQSYFGGSTWEWDEASGQFYLHLFHRKQPDLNWRNPEVRAAIYDVMRFWFERGVDGFRLDVIWVLIKDEEFKDNPPAPPLAEGEHETSRYARPAYEDRPEMETIVREMRAVSDEFAERVLIGEIYLPVERLVRYYGEDLRGLQLPFNFGLVTMRRWDAAGIRAVVEAYEAALPAGAWPNWVLGNHDVSRIATRSAAGRLAQMLLLTLRGTPTCYYGDELGMVDGSIPPERSVDPQARVGRGRDPARIPMRWDDGPGAGFSSPGVEPWLPMTPESAESVARQEHDPRSHLALFRQLVRLRRELSALALGSFRTVETDHDDAFAFVRELGEQSVLVVLNVGSSARQVDASAVGSQGRIKCSTGMDRDADVDLGRLDLRPYEGIIALLA